VTRLGRHGDSSNPRSKGDSGRGGGEYCFGTGEHCIDEDVADETEEEEEDDEERCFERDDGTGDDAATTSSSTESYTYESTETIHFQISPCPSLHFPN